MIIQFRLPPAFQDSAAYGWAVEMVDALNVALSSIDVENLSDRTRRALSLSTATGGAVYEGMTDEERTEFRTIAELIRQTADRVATETLIRVEQTKDAIISTVASSYVAVSDGDSEHTTAELKAFTSSQVQQTAEAFTIRFDIVEQATQETADELSTYISEQNLYIRASIDGLELGRIESPYKVLITNEQMSFLYNNIPVAYVKYNYMYIQEIQVLQRLAIGSADNGGFFDIETTPEGVGWKWREVIA
ncbi:MAG: hypothetical protein LBD02_01425 [Christensenellaceae bacterium]|jgi:hypothetical protein|nr:hypothetical protein [Christensenellaceae bacterium]